MTRIEFDEVVEKYKTSAEFESYIEEKWLEATQKFSKKIVVLDDDLTGIQTVNNVWVLLEFNPVRF
ncbi:MULTISPECIES: hypothetical protein [unclassified Thermotoga]|uniref:hypothetical protein n=1 Tax=unclassified Thermotoga TaxID=2631113 RepID=UPI000280E745|nr:MULTISPECIES: hypothetical protein [unclassified Thermotoga]AIY87258.1 hypothetical protein T2812B_08685 [Thermotoga sp. 2812B]EJX26380.1 hypothetical protein EMP_03400 [Thermotoga sp. EMP]